MSLKKDRVIKSLTGKGFVEIVDRKRDHRIFCLRDPQDPDKYIPHIRTQVSMGSRKYKALSEDLVSKMRKQLHFDSKKQFLDFLKCDYTLEEYYALLKAKDFDLIIPLIKFRSSN
ncbi:MULTISPECIES: hypothetical protein [unclassified Archaeoglobus]|jgi:hypothetical protein|uniref:hypothetical protein n=1 Tax=unclassified Archaeoglobus TaxID=2643606 RepID=UPI0025BC8091|nr:MULTISPECIES: hypothetical protein [unclassified Archaeoglobus]